MPVTTTTEKSFFARYRYLLIGLGIILFMPPLSFLFQFTLDSNFCGPWCVRMWTQLRQGMTGTDYLLGLLRNYMGVILIGGVLTTTFFFGRYWCSHACPVGGSMEMGSLIVPRFLKINYTGISASAFRYGYLIIFVLAPILGIGSICCSYCNFATIPRMFGAAFSPADTAYFLRAAGLVNLGLVVALGFAARGGRAYCNLLCPIGAMDSLINRIGAKFGRRMRVDETRCNGCGDCRSVCPMWAIDIPSKAEIDHFSCIPCRKCESKCARGAISYDKDRK